jgi:hypothetical protein
MTEFSPIDFNNSGSRHVWIDRYEKVKPSFVQENNQEFWTRQSDILVQTFDGNRENFIQWLFQQRPANQYKVLELLGSGKWDLEIKPNEDKITKKQIIAAELFCLTLSHYYGAEPSEEVDREQFQASKEDFFYNYRCLDMRPAVINLGLVGFADVIEDNKQIPLQGENDSYFLRKVLKKTFGKNLENLDPLSMKKFKKAGIIQDEKPITIIPSVQIDTSKPQTTLV